MKRAIMLGVAVLVALCSATATNASNPIAKQVAALQRQVSAQQRQIAALESTVSSLQTTVTTLQGTVNTVGATLTCRVAQLWTIDYGFIDIFDIIAGQPESYAGQAVPDNGTCAQVGLTPPSPAPDRYLPPGLTPEQATTAHLLKLLGYWN